MRSQEQPPDSDHVRELADRQLRYEQRYFDSLNNIYLRLEDISKQNKNVQLCLEECRALRLAHQKECSGLSQSHHAELSTLGETIKALELAHQKECSGLSQSHHAELSTLGETIKALELAHQKECSGLSQAHHAELSTLGETIRLRNLGIEQLQQELSQQSFLLVNAQAELAYARSRHPRARMKRLLERLGFLITPLFPIAFLRRSKRLVANRLRIKG